MSEFEDGIRREIIITDCQLFQAGLIILNQDVKSYIKGGWYIRQAWKRYRKLYQEVLEMYTSVTGRDHDGLPSADLASSKRGVKKVVSDTYLVGHTTDGWGHDPDISREMSATDFESMREESDSVPDFSSLRSGLAHMSVEELNRLLGAVCFGYGIFRLFITLIPPKILWWIQFLGFEGDQDEGLALLEFTSQSDDVKAPIATYVIEMSGFICVISYSCSNIYCVIPDTFIRCSAIEEEKSPQPLLHSLELLEANCLI